MQNQDNSLRPQRLQKSVPIKGMHCASCEILVGEELEAIPGVEHVHVSLSTKSAVVTSSQPIADKDIETAVQAAGYEVGIDDGRKPLFTRNRRIWKDAVIGAFVITGLILIFNAFGIDKLFGSTTNSNSVGVVALLIGLTAGFSTCMALIGGLVLSVASKYAENHPSETALQKFRPHLIFNLGRIISFVVLGAVIGAVGSAFALKGSMLGFLTIIVGIVMLVLGLQLTELFPRITKGFTLPSGLAKKLGIKQRGNSEYSHKNAFLMGAATFFLPCGFTQAMQLLAVSTGSPVQAALIMGAFALGTAPGLLSLGGLTSIVKGAFAQRFFRIVGVVVVAMALINFTNGYTLMGLNRVFESFKSPESSNVAATVDSVDTTAPSVDSTAAPTDSPAASTAAPAGPATLTTTYKLRGDISPSKFTAKVGQKTTLIVDVQDNGQGCMSTIMIIGLDETPQYLSKGKKLELTFTATKPGTYTIACAMGIPRGSITVTQ